MVSKSDIIEHLCIVYVNSVCLKIIYAFSPSFLPSLD